MKLFLSILIAIFVFSNNLEAKSTPKDVLFSTDTSPLNTFIVSNSKQFDAISSNNLVVTGPDLCWVCATCNGTVYCVSCSCPQTSMSCADAAVQLYKILCIAGCCY